MTASLDLCGNGSRPYRTEIDSTDLLVDMEASGDGSTSTWTSSPTCGTKTQMATHPGESLRGGMPQLRPRQGKPGQLLSPQEPHGGSWSWRAHSHCDAIATRVEDTMSKLLALGSMVIMLGHQGKAQERPSRFKPQQQWCEDEEA
uniref:Uncharacterized protein n=1 Tax=Sphaerodactylus townsendi TaxID=933632 RepID=A0ACB8F2Y5_9SAUR